jgi:dipeptidyl aminopeptidase/acylaminoacyl peptidase
MHAAPLVPSDLYRLVTASDPQAAPGGVVFFVRATLDAEHNRTNTAIWRAGAGAVPTAFTNGPKDRAPRVAPDGAMLAFVAEREGETRIHLLSLLAGGEARALSGALEGVGSLEWSPDGTALVFTAKAAHEPREARIALDADSGARHIRSLPFKSDDEGLLDGRRRHAFVVAATGSEPLQITHGDFDVTAIAWSPDNTMLAYSATVPEPEHALIGDVFTVPRSGGEPRRLTYGRGPAASPSFSPDGAEIAFVGHLHGDDVGGRVDHELLVLPAGGGEIRSLSASLGRSVGDWIVTDTRTLATPAAPAWTSGGDAVLVLVSDAASCGVYAFARDGSGRRVLAGGVRDVCGFSLGADGALAIAYSDPLLPSEIARVDASGVESRLTELNPWLAERAVRTPRHVAAKAEDGTPLDAWVLDSGDAHGPLLLEVHGGPHTAYGNAFFFEFQMLAGHGISVAYGNPRGSQSYGTAFSSAITGDWGGIDADDVLAILDDVLRGGDYDESRLAIAGGSYGGFMTTWLLGHSKRFACGVSMRAVNDLVSEVGASDLGWFLETEVEAPWTDGGTKLFEGSPMRAAHRIDAPLLILHSERDYRCPIDQGEQLFTLLRRLGKTAEFVRFTGDGHNLARAGAPRNRVLRLRAIAQWLGRHLRPAGWTAAPDEAGALFAPLPAEEAVSSPSPGSG